MNKRHVKKTTKKIGKNALIYARVSSQEQVKGYSLDSQIYEDKKFSDRNGYDVIKIFIERGESAKTLKRTELQKLIKYCSENRNSIDYVVVWKLDRLTRNMLDLCYLTSLFNELGITIMSVTETNENSATGKFSRNMMGVIAQFENDQKSERVVAGMKQAVKQGKWMWKPPLGYKANGGNIIIDEDKAPIIRKIYELFATGMYTQKQVRKELEKEGISISSTKLFYILRASIYCGKIKSHLLEDDECIDGVFEPIITPELFNKVQYILDGGEPAMTIYRKNSPEFPLRQFIRCPFCGQPLTASKSTGSKNKKYAYYHCYNPKCKSHTRVSKEKLEKLFITYLSDVKPNNEYLAEFKSNIKESYENAVRETKQRTYQLNQELKIQTDKKDKILDMYIDGKLSESDYSQKSKQFSEKIQKLQECLANLELPNNDFIKCVDIVCKSLENIEKVWDNSDLDTKQRIQQLIFPDGLIYENDNFRTASNTCFFTKKGASLAPDFNMVPPSKFELLSTP